MAIQNSIVLLGVRIQKLALADLLAAIEATTRQNQRFIVGNVNIHALNLAYEQPAVREAFNRFDIVFCDGFGVKLAARLTGQPLPERYTPPDFIHDLCRIVQQQNGSLYLLGAAPGVAERAAAALVKQTPGLRIAGVQHGYFDKSPASPENQAVLAEIKRLKPSLLLVGFGMPLQETWLAENWGKLDVNVALTVGALFDTLAGDIPRAPRWVTDHGFEWLARLLVEPRRLWRRYLLGIPLFFWRVFWHHFLHMPLPGLLKHDNL